MAFISLRANNRQRSSVATDVHFDRYKKMTARTLQIDLPDDAWDRIDRIAAALPYDTQNVETLVRVLLDIVQKGVDRPRSKEREWVIQCFGEEAIQNSILFKP